MLRTLRRYRSVPALAALAVLLGAFAPAPLLPCAPAAEEAAPELPPCHRMAHGVAPAEHGAPSAPDAPAPQPDLQCCSAKAPLAPAPEQPAPAATGIAEALETAFLAPPSLPRPVEASDLSPPRPAPRHLLFGCFLT